MMYMPKSAHRKRLDNLRHIDRTMARLDVASSTFAASAIGLIWCAMILMVLRLIPMTLECVSVIFACVFAFGLLSLVTDFASQYLGNLSDKWERESKRILRNRKR